MVFQCRLLPLGALSTQVVVVAATLKQFYSDHEPMPKSPCAPADAQLESLNLQSPPLSQTLLGSGTAAVWTGPKFYLYESGVFNFTDRVACYFDVLGKGMYDANKDGLETIRNAENTTDVLVLEGLRQHPGRVWDALLADLHIIGAAMGTSMHAAKLEDSPCGTVEDHLARVEAIKEEVKNTQAFQEKGGRSWMLIDTDWDWGWEMLTPAFTSLVVSQHMILGTVGHDVSGSLGVEPKDTVVLPYRVHHTLEVGSRLGHKLHRKRHNPTVSFTFHGNMHRKYDGSWRWVVQSITEGLDAISVEEVELNGTARPNATDRTAGIMLESAFCLVPAGDSTASSRLFDALAAGCVPIVLSDFTSATISLPFTHSIDWSQLIYFAGDLPCLAENVEAARDWLRAMWERNGDRDVVMRRHLGRQTYADMLSYTAGDLVSPMLAEAGLVLSASST